MKFSTKLLTVFFLFLILIYVENKVSPKNYSFPRPEEFGISVELEAESTDLTVDQETVLIGIVRNLGNKSVTMKITVYSDQSSFRVIEMNPEWGEEKTLKPFEEIHIIVRLSFKEAGICKVGLMLIMPDKPAASEPIVFNVKEKPASIIDILWKSIPFVIVILLLISIVFVKRVRTTLNTMLSMCYSRFSIHKDETIGHFTIFIFSLLTLLLPMLPEEFVARIFQAYLILLLVGIPILAILDGFLYRRTWLSFIVMFTSFMIAGLMISSIPYFSLKVFLVYIYFGFIAGMMGLSSSLIMLKKKPINLIGVMVLIISIILWILLIFPWFQNIHQMY
ncbi:MAG: hypothetical protein QXN75_03700 [Thermoproteota archaeon]